MVQQTKIQFLPAEMELVSSPDIILTKNAILQKIKSFFEELQMKQQDILKNYSSQLPEEVLRVSPKISRGENYKGLPWLVLDNPRHFQHNNIFAIRTMFWWGNFFSISLHLSGDSFSAAAKISEWLDYFTLHEFFVCVNESEWEHHFEPSNFISINENNHEELKRMANKSFFKVAKKIELSNWDYVPEFLEESFRAIIEFIKINFPGDEKAL